MFLYQHREQIPVSLLSEFIGSLSCESQLISDWSRVTLQLIALHCLHATNSHQTFNEEITRGAFSYLPYSLLSSCHSYSFSTSTYAQAAELCSCLKSDLQSKSVDVSGVWNVPCPFYVGVTSEQMQVNDIQSSQLLGANTEMSSEVPRSAFDALVDSREHEEAYAPMAVG
jgi:hypothetical protein